VFEASEPQYVEYSNVSCINYNIYVDNPLLYMFWRWYIAFVFELLYINRTVRAS